MALPFAQVRSASPPANDVPGVTNPLSGRSDAPANSPTGQPSLAVELPAGSAEEPLSAAGAKEPSPAYSSGLSVRINPYAEGALNAGYRDHASIISDIYKHASFVDNGDERQHDLSPKLRAAGALPSKASSVARSLGDRSCCRSSPLSTKKACL